MCHIKTWPELGNAVLKSNNCETQQVTFLLTMNTYSSEVTFINAQERRTVKIYNYTNLLPSESWSLSLQYWNWSIGLTEFFY